MTSQAMDFELIRQKDHILALVNDEKYEEALMLLKFIEPLWEECSYSYKAMEVRERIKSEVRSHINCSSHWKTEEKWRKLLQTV